MNFRELPRLIDHARAMALDGISFLAADVSSSAFGARGPARSLADLALDRGEIAEFAAIVERTIAERADDFESGFIAESPAKLRRLPKYYEALASGRALRAARPATRRGCRRSSRRTAPSGPCFFHEPIGSIRDAPLASIVAQPAAQVPAEPGRRERSGLRTVRVLDQGRVEKPAVALSCRRTTRGARSTAWRRITTARTPTTSLLRGDAGASDRPCCCGTWPRGSHVLDLGCGPGTDAATLAARGYTRDRDRRVAGDGRRGAPARASRPASRTASTVHHLGIEALDVMPPACVDAAYSNFGPLNCVDELDRAAQVIAGGCGATAC